MSKINELKKQNPQFNIDIIEIINNLFGNKSKYTELSINLLKDKLNTEHHYAEDLRTEMIHEFGVDEEFLKDKTHHEIRNIFKVITEFYGWQNFILVNKFTSLNERKMISQNDLTKYKNFKELELQISLSELRLVDKELEKQTIILLENDEWLVLKPMSFLASKKYGANTKWCTTQENNPEYYLRYSRRGILIYCLNKITGEKVAAFKSLDNHEKETSFWDIIDNRIDSMEANLPDEVMNVIKHEFRNTKKTNWELLSEDERNRQLIWIESNFINKKGYDLSVTREDIQNNIQEPVPLGIGDHFSGGYEEEVPLRARIIPFIPNEPTSID